MEGIVIYKVLGKSKTVTLTGLPFEEGDEIEITVHRMTREETKPFPTVQDWRDSGLIGMWADRDDINDSALYVEGLRERLQRPRMVTDDPNRQ